MTNQEKDELRRLVKHEIKMGRDIQEATAKLKQFGYGISTIKRYYRAFAGSMTVKQKAINLITELGCSYEFTRADYPRHGTEIEVFPPEGYLFDDELGSLACHSWEDVMERLPQFEITKEKVEKTKDHRFER